MKFISSDLINTPVQTSVKVNDVTTDSVCSVYDYLSCIQTGIIIRGDKSDTICRIVDTSLLHFVKTGHRKKIEKWDCEEYKPISEEYKDISLWATNSIPWYVNPRFFGSEIKGGIVEVYFEKSKGRIILKELKKTFENVVPLACPAEKEYLKKNILNPQLRNL